MGKSPAFQLYASDFYVDTNTWTIEEVGIYTRLLLSEWVNGGLPDDAVRLARASGCGTKKFQKSWGSIQFKFHRNGNGLLVNDRLEDEREKQSKYKESQSQKGKLSAIKRGTVVRTGVEPRLQPEVNSSSSSSSSIKKKNILSDEEWIEKIKTINPWINWEDLNREMDTWLLNNPKRKKTRQFITNWIIRKQKDKPMESKSAPVNSSIPVKGIPNDLTNMLKEATKEGWKV